MGKWCLHASLFLGNKDMFKNYKRFDFWHVQTADIGGTKPWKNNCFLIWKLFKFLMTLLAGLFEMKGCWHIGLRWAIVALWATCLIIWTKHELYFCCSVFTSKLHLHLAKLLPNQENKFSINSLSIQISFCRILSHKTVCHGQNTKSYPPWISLCQQILIYYLHRVLAKTGVWIQNRLYFVR